MKEIQKCCGEGCQNQGEPQEGFDFFVCDDCFAEFDFWLNFYQQQEAEKPAGRAN